MRLDRFLAEAGIGTKKCVRLLVSEGRVTVNDQSIENPAMDIDEASDIIRFGGKVVVHSGRYYYMFHKPQGCITATKDDSSCTVLDYFEVRLRSGLFPVGRLDKDTEGLLLMTNDGEFSHRLMFPAKQIEKTYFFWAYGTLAPSSVDRLLSGVLIGEGEPLAKAIRLEVIEEGLLVELEERMKLVPIKDIKAAASSQRVVSGNITITEGRKHQVKRMLKAVGCYVAYLKRVSIGGLILDETLQKGQYRELTKEELRGLYPMDGIEQEKNE